MRRQRQERRRVLAGALWKARQERIATATTVVASIVGNREEFLRGGGGGAGMKSFHFDQHKVFSQRLR